MAHGCLPTLPTQRRKGRGFVPNEKMTTNGRGEKAVISDLRERVSLLGGKFELPGKPGRGTIMGAEVESPETGEEQHYEG